MEQTEWENEATQLRIKLAESHIRHYEAARIVGCSEPNFSAYINGKKKAPEDFYQQATKAIECLLEAEEAKKRTIAAAITRSKDATG